MFCPQCGKDILDGAVYCSSCGAALDDEQTTVADDATNPFAVGAQTTSAFAPYDSIAPEVPTGPFGACKICLKKYAKFSGRASRSELWYWALFNFLAFSPVLALILVSIIFNNNVADGVLGFITLVFIIWLLVAVCPTVSVIARRLHDANLSCWLFLVLAIPIFTGIAAVVIALLPGTPGPNKYGPQPARRQSPESFETY